jgi:hypothetical protein
MKKRTKRMRGHNQVWLSGYVEGKIVAGTTRDGGNAFSFSVASEDSGQNPTRVRINAYGPIARKCDEEVAQGAYCTVLGELMNRSGKYGKLTEIRAKKVDFFPSDEGERNRGDDVREND